MDLKDILSEGLTAEDFDVLIKGVDSLPEAGMMGDLFNDLMMGAIVVGQNPSRKDDFMKSVSNRLAEKKRRAAGEAEDMVLLKGKLILLKRLLLSNEAIKMTNDILNTPPLTSNS
jgi:hypothetical protein